MASNRQREDVFPLAIGVFDTVEQSCFERDQQRHHEDGPDLQRVLRVCLPQIELGRRFLRLPNDEELQQCNQQRQYEDHAKRQRAFQLQQLGVQRAQQRHQPSLFYCLEFKL